jgi:hypothetical protein
VVSWARAAPRIRWSRLDRGRPGKRPGLQDQVGRQTERLWPQLVQPALAWLRCCSRSRGSIRLVLPASDLMDYITAEPGRSRSGSLSGRPIAYEGAVEESLVVSVSGTFFSVHIRNVHAISAATPSRTRPVSPDAIALGSPVQVGSPRKRGRPLPGQAVLSAATDRRCKGKKTCSQGAIWRGIRSLSRSASP